MDDDIPACPCPSCGKEIDAASNVFGERRPNPGDLTICIHCGHLMAFGEGLVRRELTDDEIAAAAGDPQILMIQWARGAAVAAREGKPVAPPLPAVRRLITEQVRQILARLRE